jgi:hypothetical protein
MLSDDRGGELQTRVDLPAYDKTGAGDFIAEPQRARLVADVHNLMAEWLHAFPAAPLRSGDELFRIKAPRLQTMLEAEFGALVNSGDSGGLEDASARVSGWSGHAGRKVLVATLEGGGGRMENRAEQRLYDCRVAGYLLSDAACGLPVKTERLYTLRHRLRSYERVVRLRVVNEATLGKPAA